DEYVAALIGSQDNAAVLFWYAAMEFVEQEYRRLVPELLTAGKAREIHPDSEQYARRYEITLRYSRDQAPLLLRALNILVILLNHHPEIDGTGYYPAVLAQVRQVRLLDRSELVPLGIGGGVLLLLCMALLVRYCGSEVKR